MIDDDFFEESESESSMSSASSFNTDSSIDSNDLFEEEKDPVLVEGELMKFKPGLTVNFIPRYVQMSKRAFRYFKSKVDSVNGKPMVCFRKRLISNM